jgi:hypothetical protein
LIAGFSSFLSGFEVAVEHFRAGYSVRAMYTPVLVSPLLLVAGAWAAISRPAARVALPIASAVTVIDGLVGFYYHVRNIHRRPGGWRIPITNVVMGAPLFAPLLFALSGYLGLIASLLRREGAIPRRDRVAPGILSDVLPPPLDEEGRRLEHDIREGKFQQHLAAAAAVTAFLSGVESLYSHYQDDFSHPVEWTPVVVTPLVVLAGTLLPLASIAAIADGGLGFYYHLREIVRRPGGRRMALYNTLYGPPLFAPLLFAASGFMGLVASLLRRAG